MSYVRIDHPIKIDGIDRIASRVGSFETLAVVSTAYIFVLTIDELHKRSPLMAVVYAGAMAWFVRGVFV